MFIVGSFVNYSNSDMSKYITNWLQKQVTKLGVIVWFNMKLINKVQLVIINNNVKRLYLYGPKSA